VAVLEKGTLNEGILGCCLIIEEVLIMTGLDMGVIGSFCIWIILARKVRFKSISGYLLSY
jgi:hypothetical protein